MRKYLLMTLCFMLVSCPAYSHVNNFITEINGEPSQSVVGLKFDAPYLVGLPQISSDLFIGVEVGKDAMTDIFHPGTRRYVEDDKGYFGYMKVSFVGCKFNCPE